MLLKPNLFLEVEFHTNTFQLDCGGDISQGADTQVRLEFVCVSEHHHPASTMLKLLYDSEK